MLLGSVVIFFYSPPYIKADLRYVDGCEVSLSRPPPPLYKAMLNGVLLLCATYPPLYIKNPPFPSGFTQKPQTAMQASRVQSFVAAKICEFNSYFPMHFRALAWPIREHCSAQQKPTAKQAYKQFWH